jgi:hypothetical protein
MKRLRRRDNFLGFGCSHEAFLGSPSQSDPHVNQWFCKRRKGPVLAVQNCHFVLGGYYAILEQPKYDPHAMYACRRTVRRSQCAHAGSANHDRTVLGNINDFPWRNGKDSAKCAV